jgi:hypothetical protein
MIGRGKLPRIGRIAGLVLGLTAVGGLVGATLPDDDRGTVGRATARTLARASPGPPFAGRSCGAAGAAAVTAGVDVAVARRIYTDELRGTETAVDLAHVRGYRALLAALAAHDEAAVRTAVHAIVYAPHWHIVRLRVLRGSRVLADVGGPYVIAPVVGRLRWHGRTVGTFVMSVQDDAGYVKLVSRFISVPVGLYRDGAPLMGTLRPAPSSVRDGATLSTGTGAYRTATIAARAFPTGSLGIALFVPVPSATGARQSCEAARVAAWGSIAEHVAARFHPLQRHYRDLAGLLHAVTGGRVLVRQGAADLAGGAQPRRIPNQGTVRLNGRSWPVFSWEPARGQRVYFLTPAG